MRTSADTSLHKSCLTKALSIRCDCYWTTTEYSEWDGDSMSRRRLYHQTSTHPANITNLLTRHLHQTAQHAGLSTLLGLLASTHHVVLAKHLVREISRTCVVCQKTVNQVMGPLPPSRLTPAPPFTHTGADFAGLLTLKRGNPSFIKAYICLFICMTVASLAS